jgi:hypothetical protein
MSEVTRAPAAPQRPRRAAWAWLGSALMALLGSSCCTLPLVGSLLIVVGGAGAAVWLVQLQRWSLLLWLGSAFLLAYAIAVMVRRRRDLAPGSPLRKRLPAVAWVAIALWLLAGLLNLHFNS